MYRYTPLVRSEHRFFLVALILFTVFPFVLPLIRGEVFTFRDHSDYFIPLRHFTARHLAEGTLPLWNPYNASGEPWLANPQTGVFYPPAWIFLLASFSTAYIAYLALHTVLLATGGFLLFKRWSAPGSAFLSALLLGVGGPTLSLLDISNNLASLAWVPWVILAALKRTEDEPAIPAVFSSIALALCFLAGEPYIAAVAACIYSVVVLARLPAMRAFGEIGAIGVLSILLSAVQLFPFLSMLRDTDRIVGLSASEALRQSIHPLNWFRAIVPTALGAGSQGFIPSLYLGPWVVVAVMASVLALRHSDQRRLITLAWLALLASVGFLAAGRFNPVVTELPWIAGLSLIRYPARLAPLGSLAICALASIGLDALRLGARRDRTFVAAVTLCLLGAVLIVHRASEQIAPMTVTGTLISAVFVIVMCTVGKSLWTARVALLVGGVSLTSSMLVGSPLLRTASLETILPSTRLSDDRKVVRLLGSGASGTLPRSLLRSRQAWLAGYLNLIGDQFDAETASPVRHAGYERLLSLASGTPRADILRFLSVGHYIAPAQARVSGLPRIRTTGDVALYEDPASHPMARLWRRVFTTESDRQSLTLILRGEKIDDQVLIAGLPVPLRDISGEVSAADRVRLTTFELNKVVVDVHAGTPAILTLNQMDADGWRVRIDGRAVPSLTANGMFRAVIVPAGSHQVLWLYRPPALVAGLVVSLATWPVLLASAIRRRRQSFSAKESART